ncbi:MAG: HDOD domain-containing protein [Candidatus Anammoxibacter sp.]
MITDLRHFIEGMKQLPTLSPVAAKLIEVAGDEKCGISELSRLIGSDQSLAAKVIRLANFSYLNAGHTNEVSTVSRAVSLLGVNMVRSVALTLSVVDLFDPKCEDGSFNLGEFWGHSISSAIASELFAKHFSYKHPDEAFFAGLLHDLGKFVFFYWNRDRYNRLVAKARSTNTRLLEREEVHLGMGHTKAAKMLMEQWKFPQVLITSAWLHHQPLTEFGSNQFEKLPFIVKCANTLCHIQRFGDSGHSTCEMNIEQLQKVTDLSAGGMKKLSTEVLNRFEEVSGYFNWKSTTTDLYLDAVSSLNYEASDSHVELMKVNRENARFKLLVESLGELQVVLQGPTSISKAIEKIVNILERTAPNKRLMVFLFIETEKVIEGWIKFGPGSDIERIALHLDSSVDEVKHMRSREMALYIEEAIKQLSAESTFRNKIIEALRSPKLLISPLKSDEKTLGHIMVEPEASDWTEEEEAEFYNHYAKCAGIILDQILFVESLDQQSEDMAKMARKAEDAVKQLYYSERLASVGRLAAGAAHEINNPLSVITMKAQILQAKTDDEKVVNDMQVILDQSFRIAKITKDLMGVARPAEPKIELTEVVPIVESTLGLLENQIVLANIEVRREYGNDVFTINADGKQLEQVFLNLIVNAIHAMANGGVLTVKIGVDHELQRLKIEYRDTGIGIKPQDLSRIFDPFYTSKKEGEGTGLGLSICNSIIDNHNGEITASSEPGKGTTFTISLPFDGKSLVKKVQFGKVENMAVKEKVLANDVSVLIIDDEEALRTTMLESLSEGWYKVDTAADGVEGITKLTEKTYNVVVLDLRMPRKKGLEVLEVIKERYSKLPVIIISGVAHESEFDSAKNAGAFACLRKPFDINAFRNVVNKAIESN